MISFLSCRLFKTFSNIKVLFRVNGNFSLINEPTNAENVPPDNHDETIVIEPAKKKRKDKKSTKDDAVADPIVVLGDLDANTPKNLENAEVRLIDLKIWKK